MSNNRHPKSCKHLFVSLANVTTPAESEPSNRIIVESFPMASDGETDSKMMSTQGFAIIARKTATRSMNASNSDI
jgi:hypothetical protein